MPASRRSRASSGRRRASRDRCSAGPRVTRVCVASSPSTSNFSSQLFLPRRWMMSASGSFFLLVVADAKFQIPVGILKSVKPSFEYAGNRVVGFAVQLIYEIAIGARYLTEKMGEDVRGQKVGRLIGMFHKGDDERVFVFCQRSV